MTDLTQLTVWTTELYRRSKNTKAHFAVIGTDMISRVLYTHPFERPEDAVKFGQKVLNSQILAKQVLMSQVPMWRVLQAIQEPSPAQVP